jgi:hypothetical protein
MLAAVVFPVAVTLPLAGCGSSKHGTDPVRSQPPTVAYGGRLTCDGLKFTWLPHSVLGVAPVVKVVSGNPVESGFQTEISAAKIPGLSTSGGSFPKQFTAAGWSTRIDIPVGAATIETDPAKYGTGPSLVVTIVYLGSAAHPLPAPQPVAVCPSPGMPGASLPPRPTGAST